MKETLDTLLSDIEEQQFIRLTKDDSDDKHRNFNKLRAFGLLKEYADNCWGLSEKGYSAIECGGFNIWRNLNGSENINNRDILSNKLLKELVEQKRVSPEFLLILFDDDELMIKSVVDEFKKRGFVKVIGIDQGLGIALLICLDQAITFHLEGGFVKEKQLKENTKNSGNINSGNTFIISGSNNNPILSNLDNGSTSSNKQIVKENKKDNSWLNKTSVIIGIIIGVLTIGATLYKLYYNIS